MNKIIITMVIPVFLFYIIFLEFEDNKSITNFQEKMGWLINSYAMTPHNFEDNFEDIDPYLLSEGELSPNDKWQNVYNGYGSSGVEEEDNNNVFFMYPRTSQNKDNTNANLVLTTENFSNFEMKINVKTEKQLRQNDPPNPWEVAWIFFRYNDDYHYYWFTVKPTGIELGKKDCNDCTNTYQGQIFLYTDHEPILKIGKWSKWIIKMVDNRITINVNGHKVIDFTDTDMTEQLSDGKVGLYNEDAYVKFDDVKIKRLMNHDG